MSRPPLRVARSSVLSAPSDRVWEWATDFRGINHELMPWMRMRLPRRSTMVSMARWQHERTIEPLPDGGSRITDDLTFEPRIRLLDPLLHRAISLVFAHRHRRLAAALG